MPHIHDLIDFTVEVFIVHNGKVLLRKHDKLGIWLSVGGHIELNEDPNQAAIREVKEEVGLDVVLDNSNQKYFPDTNEYWELIPPQFLNKHQYNDNHQHITFVYFAKAETDELTLSETEVTEDIQWFTKDEVDAHEEIRPQIKKYALSALETVS